MIKSALFINNTPVLSPCAQLMARDGYMVDVLHDADAALMQLHAGTYDIIILQESFEAESWHLCKRIRELSATPLIVINANAGADACARAINAGADYFLRKPFGPLEFLARVNSLLQRASQRQPVTVGS